MTTPDTAALVAALERAVRRAEEWAGTMPAKQAVKLRPYDWHAVTDLARQAAEALRQQQGGGYVLVPIEPTLAMQDAGWREIDRQGFSTEDTEVAPIYRAMIAAAPAKEAGNG